MAMNMNMYSYTVYGFVCDQGNALTALTNTYTYMFITYPYYIINETQGLLSLYSPQ